MHGKRNQPTRFRHGAVTTFIAIIVIIALGLPAVTAAQDMPKSCYTKLSPMLRTLVRTDGKAHAPSASAPAGEQRQLRVCAFVQTTDGNRNTLTGNGCRILADFGDIFIAEVPLQGIRTLAADSRICRIEAERGNTLTLDSMAIYTNATPIYEGRQLPQAFTGRGVVMGIQDVGFDLTHPTFYNDDATEYRIKRFWDQLSADTIGSALPVGAEYTSQQALLDYGHSRDGIIEYHGTHTLGIAAGSGAGTKYRGMAPESDICLVSNAVNGDEIFIDSADIYKYTYATDALGFKYIFDYAESQGKPCVISFSEGANQELHGDNILYYEILRRITGPGRIIVASAGNAGLMLNYVNKPYGLSRAGSFILSADDHVSVTTRSKGPLSFVTTLYDTNRCTTTSPRVSQRGSSTVLQFSTDDIMTMPDMCINDTLIIDGTPYVFSAIAYPSCYDHEQLAMDITLTGPKKIGFDTNVSMELTGNYSSADMFTMYGQMLNSNFSGMLNEAECSHNINSPSSAPSVISVGATSYRQEYDNISGETIITNYGQTGLRSSFSSVGPTLDGRIKPDVMAPGANVISAIGNTYIEHNSSKAYKNVVATQSFQGKEYGWIATGGTSMSAPAVGGIIALWLQANPHLTPDDVLGIIARTSKPCGDYGKTPNNYCGYGTIDAYAGLLDALNLSGIDGISKHNPQGTDIALTRDNRLNISLDEAAKHDFSIKVYDTGGRLRQTTRLLSGATHYEADLSQLPSGVYAVQIDSRDRLAKGSVLIRKQ